MIRAILLTAVLPLSACASTLTRDQSIYSAYGTYAAALKGAETYAVSPTANPAVVHQIRKIVDGDEVRTAVSFGKAYVACSGNPQAASTNPQIICQAWDFRHPSSVAVALRSAAAALLTATPRDSSR